MLVYLFWISMSLWNVTNQFLWLKLELIHFYLDLDAASENAKLGWQKLHSLQAGLKWPYWRSEVTEVHAELKEVVKKIKQFQGKNS